MPCKCVGHVAATIELTAIRVLVALLRLVGEPCTRLVRLCHTGLECVFPRCIAAWIDRLVNTVIGSTEAEELQSLQHGDDQSASDWIEGDVHSDDTDIMATTEEEDDTLLHRLWAYILRLSGVGEMKPSWKQHNRCAQTPLVSPDDHTYTPVELYKRRHSISLALDTSTHQHEAEPELFFVGEPGWAVKYMEQDTVVPSHLSQRMRRMMHTAVPLNLFRAEVEYPSESDGDELAADSTARFLGVVTPDSFPPTPITRDLQTCRIRHYTATVLDHTTLALRRLHPNYGF